MDKQIRNLMMDKGLNVNEDAKETYQSLIDQQDIFTSMYMYDEYVHTSEELWDFISCNLRIPDYLYSLAWDKLDFICLINRGELSETGKEIMKVHNVFTNRLIDEDFIIHIVPKFMDIADFMRDNITKINGTIIRHFKDNKDIWSVLSRYYRFNKCELHEFNRYINWELYFLMNFNRNRDLEEYANFCDFTGILTRDVYKPYLDMLTYEQIRDFILQYEEYIDLDKLKDQGYDLLLELRDNLHSKLFDSFIYQLYGDQLPMNANLNIDSNMMSIEDILEVNDIEDINPLLILTNLDKVSPTKVFDKYRYVDINEYEVIIRKI